MRVRSSIATLSALVLAACGGGPGAGSAGPSALAYSMPSMASAQYISGDTTVIEIDAMGQSMQMNMSAAATYDVAFSPAGDGLGVTVSVADYSARMTQPMGAPLTADEGGIEGDLVYTMDRRGNVTVTSAPTTKGNAEMTFTPNSMAHGFFPGLPGTAAAPGDMWVDTVQWSGTEGQGEVDTETILTYTIVGDTVVDGRALVKIGFEGSNEMMTSMSMQGVDVVQRSEMDLEGHVLWDMSAGLMYEMLSQGVGSGSAEAAVMPQPMGMSMRTKSRMKLAGGM